MVHTGLGPGLDSGKNNFARGVSLYKHPPVALQRPPDRGWPEGPGQPIVLALCGPDGEEVAVSLEPKRALTLAQELLTCAVQAITADPEALLAPE